MYHSLIIGDKNTFDDFGLIPTSRPVINPPSPNFVYVEVPGLNGVIDVSQTLTGKITYSNRQGSIEFLAPKNQKWSEVYSKILSFLHGKFMRVILEDDPDYYYEGRLSVNSWKSNKNDSTITIDYDLAPFKYEAKNTVNGYQIISQTLTGNVQFDAKLDTKVIETIIDCKEMQPGAITVYLDTFSFFCKRGINVLPTLQCDGSGSVRIEGNGTIEVKYRRGSL